MDTWLTNQCPTCHRQEEGQAAIKVAKKSDGGGAGEVRGGGPRSSGRNKRQG